VAAVTAELAKQARPDVGEHASLLPAGDFELVDGGLDVLASEGDSVAAGSRIVLLQLAFERSERGFNLAQLPLEVAREDLGARNDLVPLIAHRTSFSRRQLERVDGLQVLDGVGDGNGTHLLMSVAGGAGADLPLEVLQAFEAGAEQFAFGRSSDAQTRPASVGHRMSQCHHACLSLRADTFLNQVLATGRPVV
jgi:hypothetical protein